MCPHLTTHPGYTAVVVLESSTFPLFLSPFAEDAQFLWLILKPWAVTWWSQEFLGNGGGSISGKSQVQPHSRGEGSGWETFWEAELSGALPMLTSPQEWFQNVAMALRQLQLKVTGYYSHQRAQGVELASGHMKSHVHSFSSTFILSHTESFPSTVLEKLRQFCGCSNSCPWIPWFRKETINKCKCTQ